MRRNAILGLLMAAAANAMSLIGLPVKIKTDPTPWLPPEAKARPVKKRAKVRVYEGGPTVKPPMNGRREIARRLRQIDAGTLTRANGLRTRTELGMELRP